MKKNLIFVCFFTFFFILILINKDTVSSSVVNSITLWETKIFPTLFISFVIQDILINYNASFFINYLTCNFFKKLFGISSNGQMAFVLSLISGSPSNAFILSELVLKKKICVDEANHILKFSYFANPIFLYIMLANFFSISVIFKIIFSLYLSNFLLGFAICKKKFLSDNTYFFENLNFGKILTKSIKKSMDTLILILGCVTFFMILSSILKIYFIGDFFNIFISSILEITNGLQSLSLFTGSYKLKEIIAISIISFGGLSVHCQVYSIICDSKLSYKSFLLGRIYSTIIAILIIILI